MKAARHEFEYVHLPAEVLAHRDEQSDDELYRALPGYIQDESQYEYNRWFRQAVVSQEVKPLEFWKPKQYDFPILAAMARDHLAIPATSGPSEYVFSNGGDIVTKKRNRLAPDTLQQIVYLRD
jgi:hypothetical protein